jgi:hypothetical protein
MLKYVMRVYTRLKSSSYGLEMGSCEHGKNNCVQTGKESIHCLGDYNFLNKYCAVDLAYIFYNQPRVKFVLQLHSDVYLKHKDLIKSK